MQEFESISASSYDPSALATKLTAKAADGWSVVAIVPTGGDVTAFLSRDKAGAEEAKPATSEPAKDDKPADEVAAFVLPANDTAEAKSEEKAEEAVTEPAGWAIAPEAAAATAAAASTPTLGGTTAGTGVTDNPTGAGGPAVAAAAAAPVAAVAPAAAATPDPAPAPAVPAGWYADPAGRFELRYWDGTTWTEHVSRSGQQFTDPPVA